MPSLPRTLTVEVANETGIPVRYRPFREVAARAGVSFGLPRGSHVQLVLVGDSRMRELNYQTRRVDRPTDVLSFPVHTRKDIRHHPRDADGVFRLGDVFISLDTARRSARVERKPLSEELAKLFAHGVLHLVGYNHQAASEARHMEQLTFHLLEVPFKERSPGR